MPAPVLLRYEQILQRLINAVVARTTLNDLTDSSAVKHLLAACARELDEAYYQMGLLPDLFSLDTAVGSDLDARAREIQPTIMSRRQASKSVGAVVFGRSSTAGTVTVPAGTVVSTSSRVSVQTTVAGTITDGASSSGDVAAVAVAGGAAGNVAAGSLVKFDSKPPGVDTVTNTAVFVGGEDQESDDAFRARLKAFVASLARCSPEALEFVATNVTLSTGQRVRYAHLAEDQYTRGEATLYIDDGAGTAESSEVHTGENLTAGLAGPPADSAVGGEQYLRTDARPVRLTPALVLTSSTRGGLVEGTDYLLEDASGQVFFPTPLATGEVITGTYTAYTGLVAEVQKVVDGDPLDRASYPGWRAAGVRVRVRVPAILQQLVEGTLVVAEGYSKATVIDDVKTALMDYINNLGISGDVIRAEIVQRIMAVPGVTNCLLASPDGDVIVLDDQLPRVTLDNLVIT